MVVAAAPVGVVWNARDTGKVRAGKAFGADGGVPVADLSTAVKGDDVWSLGPAPANVSDAPLTIETIQPGSMSPGLDYVDAKVFHRDDFPSGVPFAWDTGSGDSLNPELRPASPLQGYTLQAGQTMDSDVIFLHFRVATDQRPLETNGVKITYRQRAKSYEQTLEGSLKLVAAQAAR